MDSDYCREHAKTCRESAFSIADGDESAGWLYLADLWDGLALNKGPAEQRPTIH
jgi:hypothetical protein